MQFSRKHSTFEFESILGSLQLISQEFREVIFLTTSIPLSYFNWKCDRRWKHTFVGLNELLPPVGPSSTLMAMKKVYEVMASLNSMLS